MNWVSCFAPRRKVKGAQPKHNQCWFAGRVLAVKVEYGLTVDPRQRDALEAMLEGCRIEHVLRSYRPEPSS